MKDINKILNILNKKEKINFSFIILLGLVVAVFDTLGIASIFPFISILSNPDALDTSIVLKKLYYMSSIFCVYDTYDFYFFLGLSFMFIILSSIILRSFLLYLQLRFCLNREFSIGKRLLSTYLSQPYSWFIKKNSSELCKNILSEVSQYVGGVLIPFTMIICQSLVIFLIVFFLLLIDYELAIKVSLVIFSLYIIIYISNKKLLKRVGDGRFSSNEARFKLMSEVFGNIKFLKLSSNEDTYIRNFSIYASNYASNNTIAQVIAQFPRFILEFFLFGGIILFILYLLKLEKDFVTILPILSVYAFSSIRLIQASQSIYNSISQIKFYKTSISKIYHDLNKDQIQTKFKTIENQKINFTKEINIKNLYFEYEKQNSSKTLKNLNLNIEVFSKVGIVGPTGCGKTTLVDLILGLLKPKSGSIKIDGIELDDSNTSSWQKNIGYVPQDIFLIDDTISANIALGVDKKNINYPLLEVSSKIAKIHEYIVGNLPDKYETKVGDRGIKLSGGQKQRIGIARALYRKPKLFVLDEGTSALDNITENSIISSLKELEKKTTIIIIAHRLNTVKDCDIIFYMENGQIKDIGNFDYLVKNNRNFNKLANT